MAYGLEACPLKKADLHSLDFVINRFRTILFKTNNKEVIQTCQEYSRFRLPSDLIETKKKFDSKYNNHSNCVQPLVTGWLFRDIGSARTAVGHSLSLAR